MRIFKPIRKRRNTWFCLALCFIISLPLTANDNDLMKKKQENDTVPYKARTFPLGGNALRSDGKYLELPFAVGLDYTVFRGISNVTDLAVRFRDFGDEGFEDISDFTQIGDVVNKGWSTTARLEGNLLPFFKMFVISGYAEMDLEMKIRVGDRGDNEPWILEINDQNNFYSIGGGGSVFFGYESLFGVVDVSYLRTMDQDPKPGDLSTDIESLITGMRVGYSNPNPSQRPWAVWTGFTTTSSTVEVDGTQQGIPVIGTIDYRVKQRAIDRNAILLGGQYFISDHLQAMFDSDFAIKGQYRMTLSVNYRF